MGGIVEKILVQDGDRVLEGQTLILLDTEYTQKNLTLIKKNFLKKEQLKLKEIELDRYLQMNSEEVKMLESISISRRNFRAI